MKATDRPLCQAHPSPAWPRRAALALVGVAALALTGCAAWRLNEARALAQASKPAQQQPTAPRLRMLVVGDSTGVGTGASTPLHSMAGRIAAAHPQLEVVNRSRDGAKLADVPAQLVVGSTASRVGAERFDVVLMQAGGNDVIRGTGREALRAALERSLSLAAERAPQVVIVPPGNVGNAPFFLPPLSWWMTHRAQVLHAEVQAAARARGAHYVNLYHARDEDPFVIDPSLNASDGLHPSDSGYAQWWRALREQTALDQWLRSAR